MKNILILFLVILLPSIAFGANCSSTTNAVFYVDYVGGSDSNDGISTSTPWQHCPGDGGGSWYQVSGSNCSLKAGDRVIFKGGVQYTCSTTGATSRGINISWAGSGDSAANRIIYDGDSGTYATRWASGTDKAIVDGNQTVASLFYITSSSNAYITINNFELRNGRKVYYSAGAFQGSGGGFLVDNQQGADYLNVSNCYLHNAGIADYSLWAAAGSIPAGGTDACPSSGCSNGCDYGSGHCVFGFGGNHINIYGNTFTDCGTTGVLLQNGSYNKVYSNSFTGRIAYMVWYQQSIDNAYTDSELHDNIFYDHIKGLTAGNCLSAHTCPLCIGDGHANWFFFGGNYHRDEAGQYGSWNNTKIYNNTIYNSYTTAYNEMHSAGIFQYAAETMTCHQGLYIYNNVIFNMEKAGLSPYTRYYSTTPSDVNCDGTNSYRGCEGCLRDLYILNNTVHSEVSGLSSGLNVGDLIGIPTHFVNVYIKNNIISLNNTGIAIKVPIRANMSGTVDIDYNYYYDPNPSDPRVFQEKQDMIPTTNVYYWSNTQGTPSWKTALGYDSHNTSTNITTVPGFANTTVGSSFDLRLGSTSSPAYRTGTNLTSLCSNPNLTYLCTDRNGVSRPSSGSWDIGAYYYGGTLPGVTGGVISGGKIQ